MKIKLVFVCIFIGLLSGCALSTPNVSKQYSLDSNSKSGLLVGSIKYHGSLSGYRVFFKGVDNQEKGFFEAGAGTMLIPIPPKSDYSEVNGKLQVVELPAGEYVIERWSVASGYAHVGQTKPFSIGFKIEPGKATYIGAFVFTVTDTMGLTVTGARVDFKEQYSEDIEVLRRDYQNLKNTNVYLGIEPDFVKENVGGESSTQWNIPWVYRPVGG